MKHKLLNLLLILFSLIGFLEWGDQQQFLFQIEWELLGKLFTEPLSILHPLTILPLLGQLLLLFTLFQKQPSKKLTYIGITCISILFIIILLVGVLGLNYKVILSSLPFLITAIITLRSSKRSKSQTS